jgi:hypothetical protein
MVARLSALRAGLALPPMKIPLLISVRGRVNPRTITPLEGLGKLKKTQWLHCDSNENSYERWVNLWMETQILGVLRSANRSAAAFSNWAAIDMTTEYSDTSVLSDNTLHVFIKTYICRHILQNAIFLIKHEACLLELRFSWTVPSSGTRSLIFPSDFVFRLLLACFLLALFFDPEDGGSMLFKKVAGLLSEYTALHPSEIASWELGDKGSVPNTARCFSGWLYGPSGLLSRDYAAEAWSWSLISVQYRGPKWGQLQTHRRIAQAKQQIQLATPVCRDHCRLRVESR